MPHLGSLYGDLPTQPRDAAHLELPVSSEDVASLHIVGAHDWLRSDSLELAKAFEDSTTYEHPFGHAIPMNLLQDEKLREVLRTFLQPWQPL